MRFVIDDVIIYTKSSFLDCERTYRDKIYWLMTVSWK